MTTFADATGSNTATLFKPSWAVLETVELNRPGIVSGAGDHSVEVSNHSIDIPMIASYQNAAMSLVVYVEPRSEMRGEQYWDPADEKFGREFIAHCDDGSTPGSFAIYRRRNGIAGSMGISGTAQWRLGGYVRNSSGTKEYFGGNLSGISTALLPIDNAKRIVLTQGPAGAELWLDGTKVGTLTTTAGWTSLTQTIRIGAGSDSGHANDRSPLWGRVDEIRVYAGQMAQTDVDALPAAQDALIYRVPTTGTLVNIADHAGAGNPLQSAMDAAHNAGGGWVFQAATDTTWYVIPSGNSISQRANCRGMVGVRLRKASGESQQGIRMFRVGDASVGGLLGSHGDPFAASGGYQYIGCKWDGNARNQDWSSWTDGTTHGAFAFQHSHCTMFGSSSGRLTVTLDSCEYYDSTGDGISMSVNARVTARGCRFYGTFRGPFVFNEFNNQATRALRFESLGSAARIGGRADNGSGMCDLEPFEPDPHDFNDFQAADGWADGDWDDKNYQFSHSSEPSRSKWYNCHTTRAPISFQPDRHTAEGTGNLERRPVADVLFERCTLSFYKGGYKSDGTTSGSFPLSLLRGAAPGINGIGWLFQSCVFIANGRPFMQHETTRGIADPANDASPSTKMSYANSNNPTGRRMTMRDCEFRVTRLPAGIATSAVFAIDFPATDTAREIELDNVKIDGAYANLPFNMGGMTVRHRDVLHERTGNATPWSGAGNVVALPDV